MDLEGLKDIVDRLVLAIEDARHEWDDEHDYSQHNYRIARSYVIRLIPPAKVISTAVRYAPAPDDFEPSNMAWEFDSTYDAALRLQGLLEVQAQLCHALEAAGPSLPAESLHSWVWEAASSLWNDGHERHAIHAAAAQIETRLQAKIGREDVSGASLIREAFTLKAPENGKSRLRFSWLLEDSEAYKSAHEGAMHLGAGCFQLIRNSAAHRPTKLNNVVAFEHLACLSFLSRLVESATVVGENIAGTEGPERPFG